MLEGEGGQVVFAENGRVAVEMVDADPQGLVVVLMDVQMPEMGGFEATRRILRAHPLTPIIGLTTHAMPQERQRCLDAGMVAHAAKPINLGNRVAAILQHAREVQSAGPPTGRRHAEQRGGWNGRRG